MSRDLALWAGVLGGPLVWLISFEANFALVPWACIFSTKVALYAVSIVAFIACIATGVVAYRQWTQLGNEMPEQGGDSLSRSRLMAFSGMVVSAFSCLLVIAQAIPEVILRHCQ